MFNNKIA